MRTQNIERAKGKKIVVIVGGGFAGLGAAKRLSGEEGLYVVLIDQRNYHLFQPLLYQVATAGLSPGDIAVPIRAQFSDSPNVEVHRSEVTKINLAEKVIFVSEREMDFDYLILACGSQHSYFGHPEWEQFAPGLKTLEQAIEIRRRILLAFEDAETELDPLKQKALLTFIVVGGGPTGVELAGAIADISRTVLVDDFKRIKPNEARIILVEAGPRVLTSFREDLSVRTMRDLHDLGVEVKSSARVQNITAEGVQIGDEFIYAKTALWAAGVRTSKLEMLPAIGLDQSGRVQVNPDLSIPNFEDVFAVGDMASLEISPGNFVPGLAPAALQEGRHAAEQILASQAQKARTPFRYLDKGQMATIGKHRAVVQFRNIKMTGYLAWLAWLLVHIFFLIGFKNRVFVMLQWGWNYLFSKRGARLITENKWELKR
jgi:NADH dehydrogenase